MNRNIAFIHEDFPMGGAETITAEIEIGRAHV